MLHLIFLYGVISTCIHAELGWLSTAFVCRYSLFNVHCCVCVRSFAI